MKIGYITILLLCSFLIGLLPQTTDAQNLKKTNKSEKIYFSNKVIVLTYHQIAEPEEGITISPSRFNSHLKALRDNQYNIINMEQFIGFMKGKSKIPHNAILITFDDGYKRFYSHAYPILKGYGFTATNFVIVGNIDHPLLSKTNFLSWDQMRQMKKEGFSFYNHTYDLHKEQRVNRKGVGWLRLPLLSNPVFKESTGRTESVEEYKKRIFDDLALAEQRLKAELGNKERVLAFPYGAYNQTVIGIGKKIGIDLFFTTKEGINDTRKREIFRIDAGKASISDKFLIGKLAKYHNQK